MIAMALGRFKSEAHGLFTAGLGVAQRGGRFLVA